MSARVGPVSLCVVLALACTKPWDREWFHADPEKSFRRDRSECLEESVIGKRIGGWTYDDYDAVLFEACMQRRGWRRP